jgi:RimJ/RimL family protein N-acetyltransferase
MIPNIPIEYKSDRLRLRRYSPEYAEAYFYMLRENQIHLREFMPEKLAGARNVEEVGAVIHWLIEEWERGEIFIWGLWEKNSEEYVGEVYLANADWNVPCIEVGYFIVQKHVGKGYATEACLTACSIAFEKLGVRRMELQCAADNEKSVQVALRCGFTLEGRLRERNHKRDGSTVDRLWFGLLLCEWQDSKIKFPKA